MPARRRPIRAIAGRMLKHFFTIRALRRYHGRMLLLAASLALSTPDPPRSPTGATAQARAIVRIVSAVRVRFDQPSGEDVPPPRETVVRGLSAELLPARLVEFE